MMFPLCTYLVVGQNFLSVGVQIIQRVVVFIQLTSGEGSKLDWKQFRPSFYEVASWRCITQWYVLVYPG